MIYTKTPTGQQVMKDRSVPLSPRQRSAFILFDGKRSVDSVLVATAGMGVTLDDLQFMVQQGLLAPVVGSGGSPSAPPPLNPSTQAAAPASGMAPPAAGAGSGRSPQQRYQAAYPIATQLTAAMGLRGFRLNLAVEGAGSFEKLLELSPKIRDAVGPDKFAPLDAALNG